MFGYPGTAAIHRTCYDILESTVLTHKMLELSGAVNLGLYIERVNCAWGRMAYRYPTSAIRAIAHDHLIKVGEFESNTKTLRINNADALAKWLGVAELDHRELVL